MLGVRPEALELDETARPGAPRFVLDVIERVEPDTLLFAKRGTVALVARVTKETDALRPGAEIALALPPAALHFFDAETGVRLP